MTGWAAVALILGAALELLGLALVALENIDIGRAFRRRNVAVFPRPARGSLRFGGDLSIQKDREPTIEERVDELEASLKAVQDAITETETRLRGEIAEEARQEADTVRSEMRFEISEVRRLLGASVAPTRRRWVGLGLFGLGLVLQTVSNLMQ